LEKAIEIKRRAQRCVQNGDLDGALREYEKLVESPDGDPYNFVLLADLLYKKGEQGKAAERYLSAVRSYQNAGLYKNAIAVCKKMSRLSLAQALVLRHLAELHALDGITSEASLYYAQYAEQMIRADNGKEAIDALRKAFDHGQENVKLLEQLSEVLLLEGETARSAEAMREAARHWRTRGQTTDAKRCEARANLIDPASAGANPAVEAPEAPATAEPAAEPAASAPVAEPSEPPVAEPAASLGPPVEVAVPAAAPVEPAVPAPDEAVTASVPPPDEERPEPPPSPGILTGSRIPGVTAPSLPSNEVPAEPGIPLETRPAFSPGDLPAAALSGLTTSPPPTAPPTAPADGDFERPRAFTPPPAPVPEPPTSPEPAAAEPEPAVPAEGVYEIAPTEEASYESALREAEQVDPAAPRPTPFDPPAAPVEPTPSMIARRPEELLGGVVNVESLLQRAQEEFRAGNRERASQALVEAALAYERLDRLDSAATIFRSLGRGANAPVGVVELWLANCEKRGDGAEASQVACELGDRALNEGQQDRAREWFERALAADPSSDTARRRLKRLTPSRPASPSPSAPPEGRVAVAVGRGQAVTFDLQGLLQEFQRGSQLGGDTQGNYDLGMAYREMGLHAEAIAAFRVAASDPRLEQRACEMCGRSLADAGQHDEAVREFERALRLEALDAAAESELRFQMALSLAASGELADAMAQAEIADMRFPGRPEVKQRLVEWRRAFGKAA